MPITGLGPHGERASPPQLLGLSETEMAQVRERRFNLAVVLHTTSSDWAKQQLAGIVLTLGRHAADVVEVIDCEFDYSTQINALERLAKEPPDAVISIPIGNAAVADAHRKISCTGSKLILLDNAPTGLIPGTDYASVVSADNFGLGQIGAELLSPYLTPADSVGILSYGIDFFATHEREIAFRKWMENHRPDVKIRTARFTSINLVAPMVDGFLAADPHIKGLFAVWDEPAMQAVAALQSRSRDIPITTVDLGNAAATEMAGGGLIKGIGAQRPFDQGVAAATAALQSLVGREPPPWVALPGMAVTRANVVEAYQTIWHAPAPKELLSALKPSAANGTK